MSTSPSLVTSSPSFPGAELPAPESRRRRLLIRAVALTAIAVSLVYLAWRVAFTLDLGVWWLSVALFVLELHAVAGLVLFTFSLWDVDSVRPARRHTSHDLDVAVLIPTYNEPTEVLLPTVAAAVALQPAHETWVLDDGDREEVRLLAERLGARYLARTDRTHAKAGNINNALQVVDVEFVAVLDADHVAAPGFLTNTLGYFEDPQVAVVQTPQDFYNLDSFEHDENRTLASRRRRKERFNEQALFYRAIQAGKNRWDAGFWCGTGAVVRVAALREVGGVATETVTEDIHTTIRLHRRGWRSVYHNEVLARGLAASSADQYQAQRLRWGIGAMQVLRTENPLTTSGLRFPQRVAYATTLLGWFDAWRSLGYLLIPPAVLLTGAVPIVARPATFALAFGTTFVLQRLALALLGRGFAPQGLSTVFEFVRMTPNLRATLSLLRRSRPSFNVTPKGRIGDDRRKMPVPALLTSTLVVSLVAAVWFALSATGHTPLSYREPWAAYGAAGWLAVNAAFVGLAIRRIRAERFGDERRASVRFDVDLAGRFDGTDCRLHDISLTGARVRAGAGTPVSGAPAGAAPRALAIPFGEMVVELDAVVRSSGTSNDGDQVLGLEFATGQDRQRARLALALFNAQFVPELQPAPKTMPAPRTRPAPLPPLPGPAVPALHEGGNGWAWEAERAGAAVALEVAVALPTEDGILEELMELEELGGFVGEVDAFPALAERPAVENGGSVPAGDEPWKRSDDDVLPRPRPQRQPRHLARRRRAAARRGGTSRRTTSSGPGHAANPAG